MLHLVPAAVIFFAGIVSSKAATTAYISSKKIITVIIKETGNAIAGRDIIILDELTTE